MTVNNRTITALGTKVDPECDLVKVDGKPLRLNAPLTYILLNKPKACISAASDPEGRPVVTSLLGKRVKARVFPVGRLDWDAEGALLLTNDGELANKLMHPRYSMPKKYLVKVSDVPDEKDIQRLRDGVTLEDGRTLPAKAHLVRKTAENSWLELTVFEGRNRLVKRMCQAIGHPVCKLKRVEFAGLRLGLLKPGEWRPLMLEEVEWLKRSLKNPKSVQARADEGSGERRARKKQRGKKA